MQLELLIRPIRSSALKLAAMNFESQRCFRLLVIFLGLERNLTPEQRVFFGHHFHLVLLRHHFKRKLRILDDKPLQTHPAHASASHDLHQRAVVIRGHEQRSRGHGIDMGPSGVQAQDIPHVTAPELVEGLVDGIFLLVRGNVVDAEGPFLFGRQRSRFVRFMMGAALL